MRLIRRIAIMFCFGGLSLLAQSWGPLIANDMVGLNEGNPQGVPTSYNWYYSPTVTQGNSPGTQAAIEGWGIVYVATQGSSATNTWVNIANMQTWVLSLSTNKWTQVQPPLNDPDGQAYPDDYQGNPISATTRVEADGTVSVLVVNNSGYNFHFYSDTRGSINPNDIGGVVSFFEARLVVGNPSLPDDRSSANYLCGSGADYYPAVTGPGIANNPGVATGKMKYVTTAWRSFAMTTVSTAALEANPPPITPSALAVVNPNNLGGQSPFDVTYPGGAAYLAPQSGCGAVRDAFMWVLSECDN